MGLSVLLSLQPAQGHPSTQFNNEHATRLRDAGATAIPSAAHAIESPLEVLYARAALLKGLLCPAEEPLTLCTSAPLPRTSPGCAFFFEMYHGSFG